jgi:hypothetical protein
VFAKWLTDPKNPRFTENITNRLWKEAFGVALIEPIDDIKNDTVASNPELMTYLNEAMIDLKYDVKQFQRAIYNSKTFQKQATREQLDKTQPYYFPGPILRRMTAEEIWDSILTLAIVDLDERPGDVTGGRHYDYNQFNAYMDMDGDALYTLVKDRADLMERKREFDNARKALDNQIRQARNRKDSKEADKLQQDMKQLRAKYSDIIDIGRKRRMDMMQASNDNEDKPQEDSRWKGIPADMVRASEMEQPAKPGHFLRDFGQSDRDIPNNGYDDSSIPQILALMNGPVFQRIMRRDSVLLEKVKQTNGGSEKLKTVWISILSRNPTPSEMSLVQGELSNVSKDEAYQDIVWALLNTREFLFVQ